MGGEAVANGDDVADWEGAQRLVNTAIETFGRLDVLVNNAGILRDRMLFNMTEEEWDAVIARAPQGHVRADAVGGRRTGGSSTRPATPVDGRVINTSSTSGMFGNPGQTNYGAAKAGIATFTHHRRQGAGAYGVTVNAIAPGARTRMTENLGGGSRRRLRPKASGTRAVPDNIAPLVVWLASARVERASPGQVFLVGGGRIAVADAGAAARASTRAPAGTPPSSTTSYQA